MNTRNKQKTSSVAFGPQTIYTDCSTAAANEVMNAGSIKLKFLGNKAAAGA
jgi:hypothetical protein